MNNDTPAVAAEEVVLTSEEIAAKEAALQPAHEEAAPAAEAEATLAA